MILSLHSEKLMLPRHRYLLLCLLGAVLPYAALSASAGPMRETYRHLVP